MGALSAAASWAAADDVLLKNAVEAGASLESLAKGAVCFSRKFTLQELQDRWCSLLYDSETSAQASACIVEYETELSTSKPTKAIKHFNSKAKDFSLRKRKIDSAKNQYYAMRKRVCHEPCLSADFGYVIAPCSCLPVGSGCVCGGLLKPSEGHHLVYKIDPAATFANSYGHIGESYAGGQDVHLKDNGHYIFHTKHANAAGSMVIDGNTYDGSLHGCSDVGQMYGCDYMQKNPQSSERNIASLKNLSDLQDYVHLRQPLLDDQYGNGVTGSKTLLDTDHDGVAQNQFSGNKEGLQEPGSFKVIKQHSCSRACGVPTRSKFQGVNSPDMLTDMHRKGQEILTLSDDKKMKTTNSDTIAFQANIDSGVSGSGLDNAIISESEFMHSHSMDFSHRKDFELLNGKNIFDSALDTNREDLGDPHAKVNLKDISRLHHLGLSDTSNVCGNHIDPIHQKDNVADVSGIDMVPTSTEVPFPGCSFECRFNTEDPEIPCNDDILIPGQPPLECTTTCDQNFQHNMCLFSTEPSPPQNIDDSNHTDVVEDVQPSSPPMKLEPSTLKQKENMMALNEACTVGSKPPVMHGEVGANNANMCTPTFHSAAEFVEETTCGSVHREGLGNLRNLMLDMPIRVPDQMNFKFLSDKPEIGCETAIQNCMSSHALPDMEFQNPIATMSTSGQAGGGYDNEDGVPNYFDIEALIFDQDLIPWDQEFDFIQPEVSRFQHVEIRKDLVRLEQGARSYMNRSIMSQGAFAILYGRHLKYYIKDPEVTLGRETGEVHVDIDLGKEGKANKISRQQAVIKMDEGGSFHIKNIGKFPIFVNSKEVPCNKRINLISDALLEIRGMKFIFHVNPDAVRQHIVCARRRSSQGENTTFDWDQNS